MSDPGIGTPLLYHSSAGDFPVWVVCTNASWNSETGSSYSIAQPASGTVDVAGFGPDGSSFYASGVSVGTGSGEVGLLNFQTVDE